MLRRFTILSTLFAIALLAPPTFAGEQTARDVGGILGAIIGNQIHKKNPKKNALATTLGQSGGSIIGQVLHRANSNSRRASNTRESALTIHADYCREVLVPIEVNGQTLQSQATACLQPDGTWQLIN